MQYKSILLDVDGTILPVGPNTIPSPEVVSAIHAARNHAHVSLVSGRPLEWMVDLFDTLNLSSPCIINGGSQIVDPITKEIIWEKPLTQDQAQKVSRIAKQNGVSYLVNDNGTELRDPELLDPNKPLAMQLSFLDQPQVQDYLVQLRAIPNLAAHEFFSWQSGKHDIYITHAGATKAEAVRQLASLINVSLVEMIGIGDAKNDIPLLSVCGLGIAMGNAHDDLKKIAHHIAPPVTEDGVARMIEEFILRPAKNGFSR